jgi:hypothetical protein
LGNIQLLHETFAYSNSSTLLLKVFSGVKPKMRILPKNLALPILGGVLSLAVLHVDSARAAIITYDFTLNQTVAQPPATTGQFNGSFSFDDSALVDDTGVQNYPFYTFPTDFNLNYEGVTYTESDLLRAVPFNFAPGLFFSSSDTEVFPLVQLALRLPSRPNQADFLTINGNQFAGGPPIVGGTVSYSPVPSAVPEPLTCAATAVAGGIGWLMKRKQVRSQKAKA